MLNRHNYLLTLMCAEWHGVALLPMPNIEHVSMLLIEVKLLQIEWNIQCLINTQTDLQNWSSAKRRLCCALFLSLSIYISLGSLYFVEFASKCVRSSGWMFGRVVSRYFSSIHQFVSISLKWYNVFYMFGCFRVFLCSIWNCSSVKCRDSYARIVSLAADRMFAARAVTQN